MEQPSQSDHQKTDKQFISADSNPQYDFLSSPEDEDTEPTSPVKEPDNPQPSASDHTEKAKVMAAYDDSDLIDEADDDTKPRKPNRKFDVVILSVPPERRMHVVDALMKNTLTAGMTMLEALVLAFQLPSLPMHCVSLEEARDLELILEYVGAEVEIRTAKYCADEYDDD